MQLKSKIWILTFIFTLFCAIWVGNKGVLAQPNIANSFDFSHTQESKDFYTDLDRQWYFFEKALLSPREVKEVLNSNQGKVVELPDSFEQQMGEVNSFGTYSTKIKIPKSFIGEKLSIHIPYQYSAYTLYIDDIKAAENGVVGENAASHSAEMAPRIAYFIPSSDEIFLTIQVSSFDHIRGGFENSIYIGEASKIDRTFNRDMIVTLFINGSIFIIGLFLFLFAV